MRFRVFVECGGCGRNVGHDVELEGASLEWFRGQLGAAGVAPLSFDHGDHVLIVYIDSRGQARASYHYPIVRGGVGGGEWSAVQGVALIQPGASVVFADWEEKKYCPAYWNEEVKPEKILPNADTTKILTMEGKEFWIFSSGSSRMIVAKAVGWSRNFFHFLQEIFVEAARAEPNIIGSPTIQVILASMVSGPSNFDSTSADIFRDLERRVVVTRAVKALPALSYGFGRELISFLESLQNYGTLGEAILAASNPAQITMLLKHYRTLKNIGIIRTEGGERL